MVLLNWFSATVTLRLLLTCWSTYQRYTIVIYEMHSTVKLRGETVTF